MKCSHCRNYSHHYLIEVAKKTSVFFILIAKWSKEYGLACQVCEAFTEVTEPEKQEILIESASLPDPDTAMAIWDALSAFASEDGAEGDTDEAAEANIDKKLAQLDEQYAPEHVTYVTEIFGEYLDDPWKNN